MSTRPTGLDQSWGFANPAAAAKAGIQVVSMYLSWDTSKNITPSDVKAYHQVGIGVMLNWEHNAGAPLSGAVQGRSDATEAVQQAKTLIADVGYKPTGRLVIYFSCDRDVNAGQFGPVFAYYRAAREVCHAAGFRVGAYGEADLVTALAKAGITSAEWQTYAWSRGVLSPDADFYQYLNGQRLGGADVDFDRIIHADQLGAWWPPGHELDSPSTSTDHPLTGDFLEEIMSLYDGHKLTPAEQKTRANFEAAIRGIVRSEGRNIARNSLRAALLHRRSGWFTKKTLPGLVKR